jgi:ketosteroid isomerase-like protein
MPHPNEKVLRSLYPAFAGRDLESAKALLAEDVVFHQPGRHQLSGEYVGIDAAVQMMRELADRSDGTFRAEPHDVLADDEHAIGLLRVTAERQGRELDATVAHVAHIHDGRITELWIQPSDQYAIDEFWA